MSNPNVWEGWAVFSKTLRSCCGVYSESPATFNGDDYVHTRIRIALPQEMHVETVVGAIDAEERADE